MKRAFVTLGTLIALLVASFTASSPAQANTIHGCADSASYSGYGMVCVFDGTDYGTYWWTQFDMIWIAEQSNGCYTLPSSQINRISSIVVNPTTYGETAMDSFTVKLWPNDGCVGTPVPWYWADVEYSDPDLRTTSWGNVSNVANSISVRLL